jgi:hypothetical protein
MKITVPATILIAITLATLASASPAPTPVPQNVHARHLNARQVTDINEDPDDLAEDIADAMKSNLAPVVSQLQDSTGALRSRVSSLLTDTSFTADLASELRDEFGTQTGDAYLTTIQNLVAGSSTAATTSSTSTSGSVSSVTNTASGIPGGSTSSVGTGTNAGVSLRGSRGLSAMGVFAVSLWALLL